MKNELFIIGTGIILVVVTFLGVGFLVSQDINQAKEVREFIYENEAHKEACMIYESREAPEWYLYQNNCR